MILFLTIWVLYRGASIAIPDDTPKSTISKENSSFNIFQDHFYNKLQRSKLLPKYTDHLYDKIGHLSQAFLHNNEPLRWFEPVYQEYQIFNLWHAWILFVLMFYSPVNPMGSCRAR